VVYELHVGTFNAPSASHVGTFLSVAEKLPYLRDLGINCIELLPATEFPGSRSWGYNPSNPFALESDYGGPVAFKELVKKAHEHGIAVVLDVVYNHFGPGDLDLWQFDGWSENGGGGIYFYNDWRAQTPWGDNRPDYGRPEVRQYIRDNALMWLHDYRVDGLRADAIAFVRNVHGEEDPGAELSDGWSLMRWINEEIDQTMPWKITIAEDMRGNAGITASVADGGQGFDSQWDSSFVYPVVAALTGREDADRDMHAVAEAISETYNGDAFRRVIYTESHDEVANGKSRVAEEIMPGAADHYFAKKAHHPGRGARAHGAGHSDAVSGPGVSGRGRVQRHRAAGVGRCRPARRPGAPLPRPDCPAPQPGRADARPGRAAHPRFPRK
jgi:1,4-alpha-glucan branching enzyme